MNTLPSTNAPVSPVPASTEALSEARFTRLSSLLPEWDAEAALRYKAKQTGQPLGPMTGLSRLDSALGAQLEPGLHHVHGNAGTGKTALALQIAASCGCPALYVTCEMRALELLRRITARVTETLLGKFKSGELTQDASCKLVRTAIQDAPNLAFLDATEAPAAAQQILNVGAVCRNLPPAPPHLLIVVDSLNSWAEGAYPGLPEYERLNTALADLREIAANLKCPILVINERNRANIKGGLNAGAGTRGIEYGAASVIDLSREEGAKAGADGEVAITLKIDKNRNGATGQPMNLKFHGALQRYTETLF